jgi:D-alanyl-D-alanine carboxypeptidase/D-alanyl-D-alanine-endopeptidase (penicillin-binding protein 4)
MIKELGKKYNNISTTSNGVNQVYQFLKKKGLNMEGLFLEDGSGLSPRNGVSAYHLSKALSMASRDKLLFPYFYNSLPLAGKKGTVKNFMSGNTTGIIRLKSGSMKRVRSYCGYVKTSSNKNYSFSIIANNFTCSGIEVRRKVEELILVLLNQ